MVNVRLALRTLFTTPFITIIAIVSIALGIGANTAVFSIFHQVLLRALPVQKPERLVNLSAPGPKPGSAGYNRSIGGIDEVSAIPCFKT
jgi:hypothetical protein